MPRGVIGEGRGEKRRRAADRCGWVEQRQPVRVGLGVRVAVSVGLADCCDRAPKLPVVLVVPTANRGVSRSQVLHCKQARAVNDVQVVAGGQCAKDPVPERVSMVLPPDRSIGLVWCAGRTVK